jgi:hypothetical protein
VRGAILLGLAVFSTSAAVSGLHWAEPVHAVAEAGAGS